MERDGEVPRLTRGVHPPIRIARFTPALLEDGVETHVIDGMPVRVFNVAKAIADCLRRRGTVGRGIASRDCRQLCADAK